MSKPDPDKLYVVIMGHSNANGTFREGERLRGDHPDVRQHLDTFFVPDGLPVDEVNAIFQARFGFKES